MAGKAISIRLPEELLEWGAAYAKERGTDRTALFESAIEAFRRDCETGVPELRALARRQSTVSDSRGVGDCPDRPGELGHIWGSAKDDERRSCRFCGRPGRDNVKKGEAGGFFGGATAERVELFSRLRAPDSAKGIKPKEKAS